MKKILTGLIWSLSFNVFAVNDTVIVSKDGTGCFETIQDALDMISTDRSEDEVIVVHIKSGIYKEKLVLDVHKDHVILVGDGSENTVITWDDHTGKVVDGDTINTYSSYTFSIRADDVRIKNMTIQNTAGPVGQAVACETRGDRIAFYNCHILGDQDSFFTKGPVARIYVKNCTISGTTDFIFGPSIALFEECLIICKKNSYITAASTTERNQFGYVFKNCKIQAEEQVTKLYLGRPWRSFAKTVFMFCELDAPIRPEGWHHWIPERELTAYYAEYKCTGKGSDTSKRVSWSHQLTDAEATKYTKANIFAKGTVSEPFYQDWLPE